MFLDDILSYSHSPEEHRLHLYQVLQILETHQLYANAKICQFGQPNLEYLGHIISNQGMAANDSKIQVMLNWHVPNSLKELRGFLELIGYYQRSIANYSNIA